MYSKLTIIRENFIFTNIYKFDTTQNLTLLQKICISVNGIYRRKQHASWIPIFANKLNEIKNTWKLNDLQYKLMAQCEC